MKELYWIGGLSFVFFCFAATAASLQGNSNVTPELLLEAAELLRNELR